MYEWQEPKTRRFFLNTTNYLSIFGTTNTPELDILSILSLELQFIFDSLYTKSFRTAFTRRGILFRIFTTLLLIASVVLLRIMNTELQQQEDVVRQARLITFLLVVVALCVEIYQLIRMLRSGWIRVWLACTYIQLQDKELNIQYSTYRPGTLLIIKTMRYFIAKCMIMRSIHVSAGGTLEEHWPGLHCMGQCTLNNLAVLVYNMSNIQEYELTSHNQQNYSQRLWYIKRHMSDLLLNKHHNQVEFLINPDLLHQFRISVMREVLRLCGRLTDLVQEKHFYSYQEFITIRKILERRPWRKTFEQYCVYMACNRGHTRSSERVILSWHIATTVCELMEETNYNITDSVKTNAKVLSRYLLYLLVHKTELLPCHAEIGKSRTLEAQRALRSTLSNVHKYIMAITNQQLPSTACNEHNNLIDQKLLIQTLINESPDLRISLDDIDFNNENNVFDTDVQRVLLQVQKLQCQYDAHINECERKLATNPDKETLMRVPQILWPGLMAGKLLMLGITNKEERWHFIWDFWIEVIASMASLNNSEKHLKHLTMGSEFLTHIWVPLGHMGFGRRI